MGAQLPTCNLCSNDRCDALIHKDGYDLARCPACGLIFVANPPNEEARARLYSFESGYHAALDVDAVSTAFHRREAGLNLRVLSRHARSGRLLDVGCSTGLFLEAARSVGWTSMGVEYSPDSSRIARDVRRLDVRTGELRGDTFAAESFDVVTLWDVIEHLPDPRAIMPLLRDVLVPGGLLVLKTPNADGLYPQISLRLARHIRFWGHAEPPGHLYQFSVLTLKRLVEQAGFETIAVYHQRIPVTYSFGPPLTWLRSAKWAVYCAAFLPLAWIGPYLGMGDDQVLVARRPRIR